MCVCDILLGKWFLKTQGGVTKLSHPNLSSMSFHIIEQPKGLFLFSTWTF